MKKLTFKKGFSVFKFLGFSAFLCAFLAGALWLGMRFVQSASYTFNQTDWADGTDGGSAATQTGWTKYSDISDHLGTDGIDVSTTGEAKLKNYTGQSAVDTSDTEFGSVLQDSGLVGYWQMDDTWDDNKGVNHGTRSGAGTAFGTAKFGSASGNFNGTNNYITLTSPVQYADTDNFSVELWYKGTDTGVNTDHGKGLLSWDNTGVWAGLVLRSGYVEYIHYTSAWQHNIKSSTLVADGSWHHIAYVNHSDETGDLYIDGVREINGLSSSIGNASKYFYVLHFMRNFDNVYTSGLIDEVAIYNRALSAVEVENHYLVNTAIFGTGNDALVKLEGEGVVGLWHLNDGSGSSVIDVKGANTGTVTNAAWNSGNKKLGASCLSFDGTGDFVSFGDVLDSAFIGAGAKFSIEAWVDPLVINAEHVIVAKYGDGNNDSTSNRQFYFAINSSGNLYANIRLNGLEGGGEYSRNVTGDTVMTVSGGWYHVVCAYDGTLAAADRIKLYINGSQETLALGGTGDGPIFDGAAKLAIGAAVGSTGSSAYGFSGLIDEVAIHGCVLSPAEVKAHYQDQGAGREMYARSYAYGVFTSRELDTQLYPGLTNLVINAEIPLNSGAVGGTEIASGTTGLVGLWHANGTVGNIDNSATITDANGTNNGTASNANGMGMAYAAGKFNQAINFDGTDDSVDIGDKSDFGLQNFSIACWIKRSSIGSYQAIVSLQEQAASAYNLAGIIFRFDNNNKLTLWNANETVTTTETFTDTANWVHFVVVKSGTGVKIYKDSVLIKDATLANATLDYFTDSSKKTTIAGCWSANSSSVVDKYNGLIDEVAIYNRALSADEIKAQYRANPLSVQIAGSNDAITWTTYRNATNSTTEYITADSTTSMPLTTDITAAGLDGYRYLRYQAHLNTADVNYSPLITDATFNYSGYPATVQTLTSSAFNMGSSAAAANKISWTETVAASEDIKFQVRTAPDSSGAPGTWSSWSGPISGSDYYNTTSAGENLISTQRDGTNDQWVQYKAILSTGAATTPTLSNLNLDYSDAPPESDTAITFPTAATYTYFNSSNGTQISGNATYNPTGVKVSIKSVATGKWYNATDFSATSEAWLDATLVAADSSGTANFTYNIMAVPFPVGDVIIRAKSLNIVSAEETTPASVTFTYNAHTINSNTTWTSDQNFAQLTITNNATVTADSLNKTGGAGQITANITGSLQIDSGSSMSTNGKGYGSGTCADGSGSGAGTKTNCADGYGASGAGYGGEGANGNFGAGGSSYGSYSVPVDLGSGGGGCGSGAGGTGGGSIKLVVGTTTTVNGTISANGTNGANPGGGQGGGGGSGGSVYIITNTLSGNATITANGGTGGTNAGGGAGGRISVSYSTCSYTGSGTATGGSGDFQSGGTGTIYAPIYNYTITTATTQAAGTGWSATVTAKDCFGNIMTSDSATVITMTNSGAAQFYTSGTYGTTTTTYTLASGVATIYVKDDTAQSITLTATDGNNKTGTSSSVTVNPTTVDHYNISEPTSATAASNFSVTITPHDIFSNTTTGSATVTLSAETAQGVAGTGTLSSVTYPALTVDTSSGAVTVTDLKYTKAESIKIKATDGTKYSTFGDITNTIVVSPATAASIAFDTQPVDANATPGKTFATQPIIKLYDANNNFCANDSTTQVTLVPVLASDNSALTDSDLSGTKTITAASGVVTYSGLTYIKVNNIKLKATSGALPVIYSNAVNVTQSLALSSPDGTESWKAGTTQNITWTDSKNIISKIKLSYAADGINYNDIIVDSYPESGDETGTYSWTVPSYLSASVKVKVEDAANSYSYDESGAIFNIIKPTITLGAIPATVYTGAGQNVTWTLEGNFNDNLSLYYAPDGSTWKDMVNGSAGVATSVAKTGTPYSWTVPYFDSTTSATAKVKLEDTFYQVLKDTSEEQFDLGAVSNTAVSGSGAGAGVKLADNLVSYWKMDGNFNDSKGTNNGTANGGVQANGTAKLGSASGSFDGTNDYVDLSSSVANLNYSVPYTVEFWYKGTSDTCQSPFNITQGTTNNNAQNIFLGYGGTGTLGEELITISRVTGGVVTYILGYQTFNRNELFNGNWHHIVVTANGTTIRLYLDGNEKTLDVGSGSNNGIFGNITNADSVGIGGRKANGSWSLFTNGSLDEMAIYNIALTQAQVTDHWNAGDGKDLLDVLPYYSSGTFTSRAIDTGAAGNLEYGKLSWDMTDLPNSAKGIPADENNLVALWRMNEASGATTVADSKGTNTGTITGAAAGASGKFGNAISFDGTSYAQTASTFNFDQYDSITWEAWIYPTSITSAASRPILFEKQGSSPGFIGLWLGTDGKLYLYIYNKSGYSPTHWQSYTNNVVAVANTWTYVAFIHTRGQNPVIYVNGASQATSVVGGFSQTARDTDCTEPLLIGRDYWGVNAAGLSIDEVAVYNGALSVAEIAQHYAGNALKFQVAGADTEAGLASATYYGPTDISDYFTTTGTTIPSTLNAKRYIKYQATLSTADTAYTPTLNDVSVSFVSSAANADKITGESNAFTISPAAITVANVEPASLVVGAMGNVTVSFTTINTLPADGKIVVTLPENFVINSGGTTAVTSENLQGSLSVGSVSGQVITLIRSGGSAETAGFAPSITLSYIKNPNDTGSTGTYSIKTTTSADKTIDQKTDVAADTITNGAGTGIAGALSSTNVEPATRYAETAENQVVSFTTTNPIPVNGKIIVTFPAGFVLNSGAATAVSGISGIDGTLTVTTDVPNRIVTLSRSVGTQSSAGAKSFTLSNIKNPAAGASLSAGGTTGTYKIQTTSLSGATTGLIDEKADIAGDHIICALTGASVTHASSLKAGATPNDTIAFTAISQIPESGKIEVDFPVGYDLSGTVAYVSGNTVTASVSGNTLILTLGAQINQNTAASIVVSGIKNPLYIGNTGTFSIRTKNASIVLIDEKTGISGNDIVKPILTLNDLPVNLYYTASNQAVTWINDGAITNSLSLYYTTTSDSPSWNLISSAESNDGTYTWILPDSSSLPNKTQVKLSDAFYQALKDTTEAAMQFGGGTKNQVELSGKDVSASLKLKVSDFAWAAYSGWNWTVGTNEPTPSFADLDNDGDADLIVGNANGICNFYENTGTASSPVWTARSSWGTNITDIGNFAEPAFADLDNDGDYDFMLAGHSALVVYENTGTKTSPAWTSKSGWGYAPPGVRHAPTLADLDGDGDYDLMWGTDDGVCYAYENTGGVASPVWTAVSNWNSPDIGTNAFPELADLDSDGDYDLLVGSPNSYIYAYENTGTKSSLVWTARPGWNISIGGTNVTKPGLADLDGDGDKDILVGKHVDSASICYAYRLDSQYYSSGTFTSRVIDTGGNTSYGMLSWAGDATNCGTNALKFQIAAKATDSGWQDSDFVGYDNTTSTYITTSFLVQPAALWHMNVTDSTAQTVLDSTVNLNSGTLGSTAGVDANDPAWSTTGKLGSTTYKALSFDGTDDYIALPSALSVKNTSVRTFEFWVKLNSLPTQKILTYESTGTTSETGRLRCTVSFDGSLSLYGRRTDAGTSYAFASTAAGAVTTGQWYHLVFVYDGSGASVAHKIYKNGVDVTSATAGDAGAFSNTSPLVNWIGSTDTNAPNMLIDEIAIYNSALTAAEVKAHHLREAAGYELPIQTLIPLNLDGNRYFKYKAFLATTDTTYTPTLNDVTISFVGDGTEGTVEALSNTFTLAGKTTQYAINNVAEVVAGEEAIYTITRKDVNGNEQKGAAENITMTSNSTGSYQFRTTSGQAVTPGSATIIIPNGASTITLYYYDTKMAVTTITATSVAAAVNGNSTTITVSDTLNVKHAAADHLRFQSAITTPQKVGTPFTLPLIEAVDKFGNILTNDYGATAYSGTKTISYTLSGQTNAPNASQTDSWTTSVPFANGISQVSTDLDTVLYRAQATTITPVDNATPLPALTPNEASNSIVVDPELAVSLKFVQQPLASALINTVLAQQPQVSVQDTYGNQTHDTTSVMLYDSTSGESYVNGAGTLLANANPVSAQDGLVSFIGLKYTGFPTESTSVIYLYAQASGFVSAYSEAITFDVSNTSTVAVHSAPQANFNLTPTNDTIAEKFSVLKFKITDNADDGIPTLIDGVKVSVGGTGANASGDIAWAELYDDTGSASVSQVSGAAITNSQILFGASADSDSSAGLGAYVSDGTSREYTVYIHMKPGKLTAVETNAYTFDFDETGVYADQAYSTKMAADSGAITPVTGTIQIATSHIEILTEANVSSISLTAGAGQNIKLQATDANRNIDINYTGNHTFIFSGLNPISTYNPKTDSTDFGSGKTVGFSSGVSSSMVLKGYKKETGNVSVTESGQSYQCHTLAADVATAAANRIAVSSGNSQSSAINAVLQPYIALVSDLYSNPVSSVNVTFAVTSTPSGAAGHSLSTASAPSDANGLASTALTMGDKAGAYIVSFTSAGLTGSPLSFSSNAFAPSAMNKISGNDPSGKKVTEVLSPLVVQVVDAVSNPVPNATITFSLTRTPVGATGTKLDDQAITGISKVTDSNGQASVTVTLGNKIDEAVSGDYQVTATYSSYSQVFSVNADPQPPYKVVLSGPSSVNAGEASGVYTMNIQDQYDNTSPVSANTVFNLTCLPSATGGFYSDNLATASIGTQRTISAAASSNTFYYKDPTTGSPIISVARVSEDSLTTASASLALSVTPAGLSYFKITGEAATMTAGGSQVITITAYDAENNIKTNAGTVNVIFSGANSSASGNNPTCVNSSAADIAFGTSTALVFTNGVATTTLKVYKAESSIHIKATAGSAATSDGNDLDLTVKHASADHLKFSSSFTEPQGGFQAGTQFTLSALNAVDLYGNLCNGVDGALAYSGTKTINYALSGTVNAPDNSVSDSYTNSVEFSAGASTNTLYTTLYRAQTTSITASDSGLSGTNTASASIAVGPKPVSKLFFTQQPSTTSLTNVAFAQQPIVSVSDMYGNAVTSANDQITLSASTATGTNTPVTNGTLSANYLSVTLSNGSATFGGVKYSYPETIYLRASAANAGVPDVYSFGIVVGTASGDGSISAGALAEPAEIASTIYSDDVRVSVFDFKFTDAGADGYGILIKQLKINRSIPTDTTGGWSSYIAGAKISDGTTTLLGTISDNVLTFGAGTSTIYTVSNAGNKTFTLSIYLKQALPSDADGKFLAFSIDPNDDITVQSVGSGFTASSALISSSKVQVTITKFVVTGSANSMLAGGEMSAYIKGADTNGNIDVDYDGDKEIIFSGANDALSGNKPTATNYSAVAVDFSGITMVSFTDGQSSSAVTLRLYKAEAAAIKAKTSDEAITTSSGDDLEITVSGGAANKLSWYVQPEAKVVANAPWKTFKVSVSDAYGNTSSSNTGVTIAPTGGFNSALATATVSAQSGIATFTNYAVYCDAYPGTVTLNATASGVTASGASSAVSVDEKYFVNIKVLDSVNGSALTELTLKTIDAATGDVLDTVTGNSPFSSYLSYDTYQFNLTKDAYVESTVEKAPDVSSDSVDGVYDNEITWTRYLMSVSESLADYRVLSDFVYDEEDDKVTTVVRLEKRGKQVESDEVNTLQTATLKVYPEGPATDATLLYDGELTEPDSNGNYWFYIEDAATSEGFAAGKRYFVKIELIYGGETTTTTYSAVNTFDISVTARLKSWTADIQAQVSGIQENIGGKIGIAVTDITGTVGGQITTAQSTITGAVGTAQEAITGAVTIAQTAITTETGKILTAAETTLPGKITTAQEAITASVKTEVKPHVKSGILNRDTTIKAGDTITISYRTDTGLAPKIDIYDPKNSLKVSKATMTESGTTGIYEYSVKFPTTWGYGDFTVICSESTLGTADALVLTSIRTSLEEISSSVSAVMGSTSGMSKFESTATAMSAQFSALDKVLSDLSKKVAGKVTEVQGAMSSLEIVYGQLDEISKQIKSLGATEGLNLEKLYDVSKEKAQDITYIKNKSEELKAAMELSNKMITNVAKKPIVQTWFEFK